MRLPNSGLKPFFKGYSKHNLRVLAFLALALALFSTGLSVAKSSDLKWDQTNVDIPVPKNPLTIPTKFSAEFHFTNNGKEPITIDTIKTSCHCTVGTVSKNIFAPGESGDLHVEFTPGEQVGSQTKKISVFMAGNPKPDALTIHADLPTWLEIDPVVVNWEIGEKPTPKTIHLKVPEGMPNLTKIQFDGDPRVAVEQKVITPGRAYDLIITPKKTSDRNLIMITLTCTFDLKTDSSNPNRVTAKPDRHYMVYVIFGPPMTTKLPIILED